MTTSPSCEALQATAALAQINYERDQQQFKVKAVSQATVDADAANLKNAQAQVAEQQALVEQEDPARAVRRPPRHPRRSTSASISAPARRS